MGTDGGLGHEGGRNEEGERSEGRGVRTGWGLRGWGWSGLEDPSPNSGDYAGVCLSPRRGEESQDAGGDERGGGGWRGVGRGRLGRGEGGGQRSERWEESGMCARDACGDGVTGGAGVDHGAGSRPKTPG